MSIFSSVPISKPKRNKFNLSQERKLTCKFGKLYPVMIHEVLPGDSFKSSTDLFMRLAPMTSPVMHRIKAHLHFFFVPKRLVWENFQDFITGGEDGLAEPETPKIRADENLPAVAAKGSLWDYFGLPTHNGTIETGYSIAVDAMPFRAYQLIYNEYYRDQNLIEKKPINLTDGEEDLTDPLNDLWQIRTRAYAKDYFTSALPWPQRGGEAIVPLGTVEPVYKPASELYYEQDGLPTPEPSGALNAVQDVGFSYIWDQGGAGGATRIENLDTMSTQPVTIETLRTAFRVQEWLEKSARGGSRYIEAILSHFGVVSSDARLQRPEFLGGCTHPIVISEVLNTAGDQEATTLLPVGDLAGHGISAGGSKAWKRHFEEHGYIIGIMSVMPVRGYHQGVHRMWTRTDKYDYYWPTFARLGEQEIKNKELYKGYTAADSGTPEGTFGYQARYAEYKYMHDSIHGDFRDLMVDWHLSDIFDQEPALNADFIEADNDKNSLDRIFAVQDGTDYLWVQLYHKTSAIRPMPYHAIPTI